MEGEQKVTLHIYSGRPDPVWTVHPRHKKFQEMKKHLSSAKSVHKTYRHENLPCHLGFKGFLLHHPEDEHGELIVGCETKDLQKSLLETMPDELISATLRQKISQAIESGVVSANVADVSDDSQPARPHGVAQGPSKVGKTEKVRRKSLQRHAPEINLPRWNKHVLVRKANNCYNYANDKITNSFAQPGKASGDPIGSTITPEKVLEGAESDGLLKLDVSSSAPCPKAPTKPNCLVALVVAKGEDYHWYRLDNNGLWSHKPGPTAATNLDGKGKPITDPRNAANSPFGPDYKFVSFMHTFTNIIE